MMIRSDFWNYEEITESEVFNIAFKKWWQEDWSWQGLARRNLYAGLFSRNYSIAGNLQDRWKAECGELVDFGGRWWTRAHLPPCDNELNLCPPELWATKLDWLMVAREKLLHKDQNKGLFDLLDGDTPPVEFADLRGVVFPAEFKFPEQQNEEVVADFGSAIFVCELRDKDFATARFDNSIFRGNVWLTSKGFLQPAHFGGSTHCEWSSFNGCKFRDRATFESATFYGMADFGDAEFLGTSFESARFHQGVIFSGATFSKDVTFSNSSISDFGSFNNVQFLSRTDFSEIDFLGIPHFFRANLHPDTTFAGAAFKNGLKNRDLESCPVSEIEFELLSRTGEIGRKAKWFTKADIKRIVRNHRNFIPFSLHLGILTEFRKMHDRNSEIYETSFRTLRQITAANANIEQESFFYGLEQDVRRGRTDVPLFERAISLLYKLTSNYGTSFVRPLWFLTLIWAGLTMAYIVVMMPPYSEDVINGISCAGRFSPTLSEIVSTVGRGFVPNLFGAGTGANPPPRWINCAAATHPLLYFSMGLLQFISLVSVVSLFLIALRRRFQIKS